MDKDKIDRINDLARKAKAEGLTDIEKEEQRVLRGEYLGLIRQNFTATLENTYIMTPDGEKTKLKRKDP